MISGMQRRERYHVKIGSSNPSATASAIGVYLAGLLEDLRADETGSVATYIPELGKADPRAFGICIATVDGQVYSAGDFDLPVSIQSVSKPFLYGAALQYCGRERVLQQVGVEPTGETFNSIVLDEVNNRPFNPMVNAGAIATTELFPGATPQARERGMVDWLGQFAGRQLEIDLQVFGSEHATGHRNRAIAWMMLNSGMIARDPEDVLDLYFKQCSVLVSCRDLAVMAATLAAAGRNPLTGLQVLGPDNVRDVLSVMSTCGMYDYAGQWIFDVGLPAKSGVSGLIMAVAPGQAGLAVYSPLLDAVGNSVRGIEVCKRFARDFALHSFADRTDASSAIRGEYSAREVSSKRIRSPAEATVLQQAPPELVVLELQGLLYFGSAERVVRRVADLAGRVDTLVLDFKRVAMVDRGAVGLLVRVLRTMTGRPRIVLTETGSLPPESGLIPALEALPEEVRPEFLPDTDLALERFEERVLETSGVSRRHDKLSFAALDIFAGLGPEALASLQSAVSSFRFETGQKIISAGDEAHAFFVVARGSVSISLTQGGRSRRVGSVGPGQAFGEMALLDGGRRSADVTADVPVLCYAFSVERIRELAADRPEILTCILGNMIVSISDRLRRANQQIQAMG
ncbi:MAG: glutaminase A [Rhodobacteraceae bacterium]|nr:glutaminase A [Paracoccaceae bacterium]